MANSLSMYSITENIYCSQLSSVAILLQPELTVSHRIVQGNYCVFSPSVLSSFGLPLPPTCLLLAVGEARSYFASAIYRQYGSFILLEEDDYSFQRSFQIAKLLRFEYGRAAIIKPRLQRDTARAQ
jgi:hypothetical protein